jgi:hypothetical protein
MRLYNRSIDAPLEGQIYSRRIGDALELAEVLEVGAFGFRLPHVKFRASVTGQENQGTKVLSVATFMEKYLPAEEATPLRN